MGTRVASDKEHLLVCIERRVSSTDRGGGEMLNLSAVLTGRCKPQHLLMVLLRRSSCVEHLAFNNEVAWHDPGAESPTRPRRGRLLEQRRLGRLARLDVTRCHCLVFKRLRVEVYRRLVMLVIVREVQMLLIRAVAEHVWLVTLAGSDRLAESEVSGHIV